MEKRCRDCRYFARCGYKNKAGMNARTCPNYKLELPTTSDLAKFLAEKIDIDLQSGVYFSDDRHFIELTLAAFCDKHNVDIKIEKRR
jgi:hypothetical protein